jgi:alpha-D-ribose 1-methylphosphonate 5-triphosphate synthase subunit PhnH
MITAPPAQATLKAGFNAPVLDAQACFKALMSALSFPGRTMTLSALSETPDGWPPSMAAAALTLLDADTAVWLDPVADTAEARAFIRFHAGAPIVEEPARAAFAFLLSPDAAPYDVFSIGVDQYPDRSATLLMAVAALVGGPKFRLKGPGIKDAVDVAPDGDLGAFWTAWSWNTVLYPLGFDAFFFAGDELMGLPRSVAASAREA